MKTSVSAKLAVGLVHHPVYNKVGDIVTTSVTTIDVHDMARLCRTYGIPSLYIVTPLKSQQRLVKRIVRHWTEGYGGESNPDRAEALYNVKVVDTIEDMVDNFSLDRDETVLIATGAKKGAARLSYPEVGRRLESLDGGAVILFGTGHGLAKSVIDSADMRLEPIEGVDDYNHLPVRCAAAIILDRLLGKISG